MALEQDSRTAAPPSRRPPSWHPNTGRACQGSGALGCALFRWTTKPGAVGHVNATPVMLHVAHPGGSFASVSGRPASSFRAVGETPCAALRTPPAAGCAGRGCPCCPITRAPGHHCLQRLLQMEDGERLQQLARICQPAGLCRSAVAAASLRAWGRSPSAVLTFPWSPRGWGCATRQRGQPLRAVNRAQALLLMG